jgi:hypothetical protein
MKPIERLSSSRLLSIKQIIQPERRAPKSAGMRVSPADHIVIEAIRM